MMKYLNTNATSKEGINFIKSIVDKANCIFNETPQQNDLGIDAQIELIKNETPTNSLIAVQIKSGNSFFDNKKCILSVENHYEYWKKYPINVIGIVYVPKLEKAYWIDIKEYFEKNGKISTIKIIPNRVNEFSLKTFKNIILQIYSNETPIIPYSDVLLFLKSEIEVEFKIGLYSGFVHYSDKNEFWELIINYLFTKDKDIISDVLIHFLSFSTNGVDVWYNPRYKHKAENLEFARKLLSTIDKDNIIKILSKINPDKSICRGSIGSSIESIVSNAENIDNKLLEIIYDKDLDTYLRENAVAIYASHDVENLLNELKKIKKFDKQLDIDITIQLVKQDGKVYFYL